MPVFIFRGRPCIVTGEKKRSARVGRRRLQWVDVHVAFLDGLTPTTGRITQGRFKTAKAARGVEGTYWQRVADLSTCGMDLAAARQQAMDEVNGGGLRTE